MKRSELITYRLRFPQEVSEDSVLAALSSFSGIAYGTKLVFDLIASPEGIEHYLGITAQAADVVTGGLRAALPSLRLDQIVPERPHGRRLLWQMAPPTAAIRADRLAPVSASLLASLFPLAAGESVRLTWTMQPIPRPGVTVSPEIRRDSRAQALKQKLDLPGLGGKGELRVIAATRSRAGQLARRTGSVLHSLATPYGSLCADPYWWGQFLRLIALRGRYFSVREVAAVIGWPIGTPDLPGLELGAAKRLVASRALPINGRVLGVSNFAGSDRVVAITPTASTKGLYVLGPTGTGKTSLLKNLIRDDLEQGRGVSVVETNGDLIADVLDLISAHRFADVVLIDPLDKTTAVGFNPFAGSADPSLTADQLGELFQRLWKNFWGPRTGQLAHMGLLTLARHPSSTLVDLPRLFLDQAFRGSVLASLDDPVGLEPDWRWFLKLNERDQANVIAPLLNKVRQFTARPSIRAIVGQAQPAISMRQIIERRKVLLVNLPKGLLGAETATLLGCLVLTSLWQAAAERVGIAREDRHPFGLYVDEVQDFASAPIPWDEMFAQGRKYGLALSVAHQNLGQLPRELREVVLANARSKAVFALSGPDAKALEPLFAPALSASDLQALDARSIAALVALDDGSNGRPVTLATPEPPTALGTAVSVRAASNASFGRPIKEVEAALRAVSGTRHQGGSVGRQPRRRP
jgi:hypothetical protein